MEKIAIRFARFQKRDLKGIHTSDERYNAAMICRPDKAGEVDALILGMFAAIEGGQRDEAKQQADKARRNEEKAKKALDDLAKASNALVKEFIQKADTAIYYLDYETAVMNTEKAALFDFSKNFKPKIAKLWMELIFWYHESHQYERAEKMAGQALE